MEIPGVGSGGLENNDASEKKTNVWDSLFGVGPKRAIVKLDPKDPVTLSIISIEEMLKGEEQARKESRDILKGVAQKITTFIDKLSNSSDPSSTSSGINLTLNVSEMTTNALMTLLLAADDKNVKKLGVFTVGVTKHIQSIAAQDKLVKGYNAVIDAIIGGAEKFKTIKLMDVVKPVLAFAGAIATIGLTAILIGATVGWDAILKTSALMLAFAGAAWLLGKIANKEIIAASIGVALLGLAIWSFSQVVTAEMLLKTSLSIIGLGVALWGFSKLADPKSIAITAVGLAVLGLAIWGISMSLSTFEQVSWESIGKGIVAIGGLMAVMALAGSVAPIILIGAAAVAAAAVAIGLLTASMFLMGKVEVNQEQIDKFQYASEGVAKSLAAIGNPLMLPFVLVGAASAIAIGAGTLVLAAALAVLSTVRMPDDATFDSFEYGLGKLGDAYEDVGGPIRTPLILLGVATAVSMSIATVLTAGAIKLFSKLADDPKAVETAITSLKTFVDGTSDIFTSKSAEDYLKVTFGVAAFAGVAGLVSSIANSVAGVSKLRFDEGEVINGKFVIKKSRQLTEQDFKRVGDSISMIISSLTEPLSKIGADTGLLSDSDVENGIEALSGLGTVINPLANIVTLFTAQKIDSKAITAFNLNIKSLVDGISSAFINDIDINDDSIDSMEAVIEQLDDFIEVITNKDLEKGSLSMSKVSVSTGQLKTAINDINLAKLTKFNDMLVNLQTLQENDGFEELVEKLDELIDKLIAVQSMAVQQNTIVENNTVNQQAAVAPAVQEVSEKIVTAFESGNEAVVTLLEELKEMWGSGQLKVRTVPVERI